MVTFYYTIQSLVNRVENEAIHKVRRLKDSTPEDLSIKDAEDIVKDYLRTMATDIASKHLGPLGRGLELLETPLAPFGWDVSVTDGQTTVANCVVFLILEPTTNWDINTRELIRRTVEDTLVSYAVWKWTGDPEEQIQHVTNYDNLVSLVKRRIKLRRTYSIF